MTQRADRTDGEEGFDLTARHGSLAFRALTAGASASTQEVAHLEYRGLAISEFTAPVHEVLNGWVTERKRVHLLVDASRLESYETQFRKNWLNWFRANEASLGEVHILFRSRLVQMGISLVNAAIGGQITPHSDPEAFRRVCDGLTRPRAKSA